MYISPNFAGNGPECYYCGHEEEDCDEEHHGLSVRCQMHDPESHYYGNACYIGHSGKFELYCMYENTIFLFYEMILICQTKVKINYNTISFSI